MKKKKSIGIFLTVVVAALAVTLWNADLFVSAKENEELVIPENVYIGDIDVGGMTEEEAVAAVESYVQEATNVDVVLTAGENSVTVKAEELGLDWGNKQVAEEAAGIGKTGNLIKRYKEKKDLENENKVYDIVYTVDAEKTAQVLAEKADSLNQEAENASLIRENGSFTFIDGKQGIEVNVENSIQAVEDYFGSNWNGGNADISLAADVVEPIGNKESLSRVQDKLGSYNTDFSSSTAARIKNIENAVAKINGTVLYPGEEFSVYEAIAPLDAANGYELAGAYENGVTVQSYGGGVCQVSTTLYNAVLYAELDITERSNHSMLVTYVSPSRDAAIAGTYKDLKFQNSTDAPIYIEGYTSGTVVTFNIYGEETRAANREVSYESETISQDTPIVQIVPALAPVGSVTTTQTAHIGQTAKLWKIVTVDGVEQSREVVNTSKYSSSPKIISVGNVSDDPNACAAINAAIESQDEATVRAVAAQYAGTSSTPPEALTAPAASETPAAPETPAVPETPAPTETPAVPDAATAPADTTVPDAAAVQ